MRAVLISRLRACLPKSFDTAAVPVMIHTMVKPETASPLSLERYRCFNLHNDLWNVVL